MIDAVSQTNPAGGVVSVKVHVVLEACERPVKTACPRLEMPAVCAVVVVTGTVVQLPPMTALVKLCSQRQQHNMDAADTAQTYRSLTACNQVVAGFTCTTC